MSAAPSKAVHHPLQSSSRIECTCELRARGAAGRLRLVMMSFVSCHVLKPAWIFHVPQPGNRHGWRWDTHCGDSGAMTMQGRRCTPRCSWRPAAAPPALPSPSRCSCRSVAPCFRHVHPQDYTARTSASVLSTAGGINCTASNPRSAEKVGTHIAGQARLDNIRAPRQRSAICCLDFSIYEL